jgi:hypothetical protein
MLDVTGYTWVCVSVFSTSLISNPISNHTHLILVFLELMNRTDEQMSWMGMSPDDLNCTTLTSSHFVPNITMGAPILEHVHKNLPDLYMDCHMMVSNPAQVGPVHA